MNGNDMWVGNLTQLPSYEDIPYLSFYDEHRLASLGSEWPSVVGVFNTFETGPQFSEFSDAQKCDAVRTLLENSRLMDHVYCAYWLCQEIPFYNDGKVSLPAGPLFHFDNGINPLGWARSSGLAERYPVVREPDGIRFDRPWFELVDTTDPRTWEARPSRVIQYPVVKMPYAVKMASVGIACHSEVDPFFQYTSREEFEAVVRGYIDHLTPPRYVQWIRIPTSDSDRGMLSTHFLPWRRWKMTANDIEIGHLHYLLVEERPNIINIRITTEVIPAHRYDEIVASDAA